MLAARQKDRVATRTTAGSMPHTLQEGTQGEADDASDGGGERDAIAAPPVAGNGEQAAAAVEGAQQPQAADDVGHVEVISQDSVRAYCCDPDRLETARDILGWHVSDFKMLINSSQPQVPEALVKMMRFIVSGTVTNEKILELARFGRGHAINKGGPPPAVRPAVSGVHLVQIAGSILVHAEHKAIAAEIGDYNVSNGSPQEALPALIQVAVARHTSPDVVVFKGDIWNAHSSIDKQVAFELAAKVRSLQGLTELRYGGVCRIGYINETRKLIYIIESRRGVLQGDPLATAAFTRAYNEVLNQVRRKFPDVTIVGIADDTYFIGAFDSVLKAWELAVKLSDEQLGLSFRPDKSAAVA